MADDCDTVVVARVLDVDCIVGVALIVIRDVDVESLLSVDCDAVDSGGEVVSVMCNVVRSVHMISSNQYM